MPRYFATSSMVSVESHPFSSWAMMSALITADCFRSGGYLAVSRSIFFRASGESMLRWRLFALPVVDIVGNVRHVTPRAVIGKDLLRVRVLADFRSDHGADGEIAQLGVRIVDDLVRGFRPAGRTADHVAGADLARLVAVAKRARACDDEEHFLVGTMAVKRAGALARFTAIGIPQALGAEELADA